MQENITQELFQWIPPYKNNAKAYWNVQQWLLQNLEFLFHVIRKFLVDIHFFIGHILHKISFNI